MAELVALLNSVEHLSSKEQRHLVHSLAGQGVVCVIQNNQLLVAEDRLEEAQQALDAYHQQLLEVAQGGHSFTHWAREILSSIFVSPR